MQLRIVFSFHIVSLVTVINNSIFLIIISQFYCVVGDFMQQFLFTWLYVELLLQLNIQGICPTRTLIKVLELVKLNRADFQ